MKLQRGFDNPQAYRGGFVSIGNFDGVHRGHQAMVATLVGRAREAGVPAVVLTFDPHPIEILRPDKAPPSLSTLERKTELLERHGVDCTIAYPTDEALLSLPPQQFFEQIIRRELQATGLVEGPNFFFGRDRAGDIGTLRELCAAANLSLEVVEPVTVNGQVVSSSRIRTLISEGNVAQATGLLGHPYRVQGRVAAGASRGRALGFPTANLEDVTTLLPPDGVYAASVPCQGRDYPAAVNLGPNPTFAEQTRKFEVFLLDFSGELYGQTLNVDFRERVRDTVRFENADALQEQIQHDIERVRAVVGSR